MGLCTGGVGEVRGGWGHVLEGVGGGERWVGLCAGVVGEGGWGYVLEGVWGRGEVGEGINWRAWGWGGGGWGA